MGGFLLNYSYTAVDTAVDLLGDASRGRMLKGLSRLQQQGTTVLERTRASSRIQENEDQVNVGERGSRFVKTVSFVMKRHWPFKFLYYVPFGCSSREPYKYRRESVGSSSVNFFWCALPLASQAPVASRLV